jgi:hypothetical protein
MSDDTAFSQTAKADGTVAAGQGRFGAAGGPAAGLVEPGNGGSELAPGYGAF